MMRLQEEWQRGEEILRDAEALEREGAPGGADAARRKVYELFERA